MCVMNVKAERKNFYPVVLLVLEISSGFRAVTGKIREKQPESNDNVALVLLAQPEGLLVGVS